jgi:formylmethanofuran dehydrogenase subunit E
MILTYKEIMDCGAWCLFCELHGVSVYAVHEGGGECTCNLTAEQAYCLSIVKYKPPNAREVYEVYPVYKCNHCGDVRILHPCGKNGSELLCDKCLSVCMDM